jgi:hypothetical protein
LNHSDTSIPLILPGATKPFILPAGWRIIEDASHPTVLSPEADLRIAFLVLPTGGEPAELALQAWRMVEPDFDQPIRQQSEAAAAGGWDATHQIVYLAAQSGGNMHIAILCRLDDRMYVSLVSGTMAAFSRRGANINEIVAGWRPDALSDVSLAGRPVARWTEELAAELRRFILEALQTLKVPGASLALAQRRPDGRCGAAVLCRHRSKKAFPRSGRTERRALVSRTHRRVSLRRARAVEHCRSERRRLGPIRELAESPWHEIAQNADRFVALTGAPWSGELRLRVLDATGEAGRRLLLDGGQIQYTFERVPAAQR